MNNTTNKSIYSKSIFPGAAQRSYNEIVEYLDSRWSTDTDTNWQRIQALDQALGNPSKNLNAILIAGTNGKSLTINYSVQLLQKEGLRVGAFYSPRILTYNEYFSYNNETISNKIFTEVANEVINASETEQIKANTHELLAAIAFVYFKQQEVDVALLEVQKSSYDPCTLCNPKIFAISRVTDATVPTQTKSMETTIRELLSTIKPTTHIISADQSKANLQIMVEETNKHGATWAMPIRKLAVLTYPFEQLHGRCAALAERICQIYIEKNISKEDLLAKNSLLAKQKGQRGRPTLEAKRQAELNPKKTVDQFWKETLTTLPSRFQLLEKEKPTLLLDNAHDVDALKNLLLGIRLLHYQRPLKGIAFIFGCDKNQMNTDEFLRLLRYFAKKNSANVFFCPLETNIKGIPEESLNIEQITNDVKSLKIKAKSTNSFNEAFELAKQTVDERHGLIVITGSHSIIAQYWHYKGMKKL